ncbi:MAG: glycosyltransferase [Candidatus Omnitrophica bacterium]|nr:glycosyltransferase [Candidatus Omnitrophota bacterium]
MTQNPFISIIIPARNAQKYIGLCLENLLSQDYPRDKYEIIIIDNASKDQTVDIIKKYPVKLHSKNNGNISKLRNWGALQAQGEIFAFIDADCIAPKDWLSRASLLLKLDNIGATGCWYALPESTTWVERTWDILTRIRKEKIGPIDWVPSSNFIVHKEIFRQIQGFDEHLITSEDVDICQRIIKSGRLIYSDPKIAVQHLGNPKTLKQFFFKEKWRGEGVLQNSFRNFPHIEINNAIIFGTISLIFCIGILGGTGLWIINSNNSLFLLSISGLLLIPFFMTIKTLYQQPQWNKFFILLLLFMVYGLGRAASILNFKIWEKSSKG